MVSFLIKTFTSGQLLVLIIITEFLISSLFMKIFNTISECRTISCLEKLALSGILTAEQLKQLINKEVKKNECK